MIAFLLSPLGKLAIVAAIVGGAWLHGYYQGDSNGAARIQAKWDAAQLASIAAGEAARDGAESDVPPGAPRLPDDRYDRDNQ